MGAFVDILLHTPWWVYPVFACVMYASIKATRPRRASLLRLLTPPFVFTVVSVSVVAARAGDDVRYVIPWGFAATLGFAIGGLEMHRAVIVVERRSRTLLIQGSVITPLLFLFFFGANYYYGFVKATDPEGMKRIAFVLFTLMVPGIGAGVMWARGFHYLLTYARSARTEEVNDARALRALTVLIVGAILSTALPSCSSRSYGNLDQELGGLVAGVVTNDTSAKNCVLAVARGDGSLAWSGASGIAHEDGQVPMTKDTPIYIASITKLYTATAIMSLYEQGRLSLDDPMARYLPDRLIHAIHVHKGKDYTREITIRQLLSHTSGIADYYDEKPKGGKSLFETLVEEPERTWTVDETIERAKELQPNFPPGTGASYSDTNFQLLGKIIETVTGRPLHVVLEELFFHPLGLTHTYMVGRSKPAAPSPAPADVFYKEKNITKARSNEAYWADGGLVSTAGEMIVFLKALNEARIVRPETLRLMHDWHKLHFPLQYGFGTMRFRLPWLASKVTGITPLWGHSGSTGSFLYYSEDLGLYMAGTMDQVDSKVAPFRLMGKVMKAVRSCSHNS